MRSDGSWVLWWANSISFHVLVFLTSLGLSIECVAVVLTWGECVPRRHWWCLESLFRRLYYSYLVWRTRTIWQYIVHSHIKIFSTTKKPISEVEASWTTMIVLGYVQVTETVRFMFLILVIGWHSCVCFFLRNTACYTVFLKCIGVSSLDYLPYLILSMKNSDNSVLPSCSNNPEELRNTGTF